VSFKLRGNGNRRLALAALVARYGRHGP
jgi:hypothetical protein